MPSQANVYSGALTNAVWYTDKVRIDTGTNSVSYQVNIANLANAGATGNTIYSNAVVVPANTMFTAFVGVGNFLTIVGGNATASEVGTASSGSKSIQAL
jgi:hypothetical protein